MLERRLVEIKDGSPGTYGQRLGETALGGRLKIRPTVHEKILLWLVTTRTAPAEPETAPLFWTRNGIDLSLDLVSLGQDQ